MLARIFRRLRPEEGLFVFAFLASAILTVYANVDLYHRDIDSRRIQGGLLRLALVVAMAAASRPSSARCGGGPDPRAGSRRRSSSARSCRS